MFEMSVLNCKIESRLYETRLRQSRFTFVDKRLESEKVQRTEIVYLRERKYLGALHLYHIQPSGLQISSGSAAIILG